MTGADTPTARPWWVPLLGVGSLGFGGVQALAGLGLLWAGTQLRGDAGWTFFLLGAAWLLPGAALAAGGVGIVSGARWGRWLSVAAVAGGAVALGVVSARSAAIPPALADAIEFASAHPEAKGGAAEILAGLRKDPATDPVPALRDPEQVQGQGWYWAGWCGCPVLPWYAVVLLACVPRWGRRTDLKA